jgi:glycosyltransferase A (GT-A) superfamily protein (DUF2064 family)
LIGMAQVWPVFHDISWSTSAVLDQTLALAHRQGLRTHLLREGRDIDTIDDLRAYDERFDSD